VTAEGWRRYLVFSVISALVPNLLLLLLIVRTISRPLRKLTVAAVQVTKGDYGTEVDLRRSNDEIGLLAESFNEMSRKMASDIENLQKMNEQLMRADKLAAMGTLAAGVAHEVNNPLASISSLIQMMRSENGAVDTGERLEMIQTQILRISRVTKDLTDFARARPAAKAALDINKVIETSLRLAEFDSTFQRLRITKDLSMDLPAIVADPDQLQQVFLNIFLNARDVMPDGGELKVSTRGLNGEVEIEISDSGPGIDPDSAKQIFDPFFTTKPAGKGTGLGLAVCYGIVTAHGGRLEFRQRENSGAVFVVSLPIA
jgi:two-component system NtrC family sensor kinase